MKRLFFAFLMVAVSLSAWADNSVTVNYNGTTATVTVDDNVAQYLTVTQSGAHVSIAQSSAVTEEITYTLSGTSSDGEFYMSGSYKATIELNGLTLTNATPVYSGAAVHIQNSKRINVKVITGTTNTLSDAASGSQKGCLYVKGHAEFKQYGTLNVVGNVSHAIKAGEYISIKNATINVTSAVGDGISCNQYFLMESGTVNISGTGDDGIQCDLDGTTSTGMTVNHEDEDSGNVYISGGNITINCPATAAKGIKSVGDVYISDNPVINVTTTGHGMWDTTDLETKAACGLNADGNITISGGTITLSATGSGGKGMSCDGFLTISGGNTTVSTSGGLYFNNGSNEQINYSGDVENVDNNYYSSPKGVKAGTKTTSGYNTTYSGGIDISGGTISVTTTGNNAEGIESKNYLNITGGEVTVDAHDDGINAAQDLTITDGYVYARGSNNDGIDANGDVFIQGGLIYAVGANSPEVAIDANSEEQKKFYFTGGTLIAIGGLERGSDLQQSCYQASSWSSNRWYSLTFGNDVIAFKTPASGGSPLVVSAASTPTVKSNVTVSSGTSIFEGRCYLDATVSGGADVSLSQYTSGGGGGPGPGQNYTITATASPSAGGSVSGAGTYPRNATCTLTATANTGYTFSKWTKNGQQVSTNATYSFQVTGNASYVANFTQQTTTYTITATANPTNGGSVTGGGTYTSGSTATLTASANTGYAFTNWTKNGTVVSTNATYSFTVNGNASYVANFITIPTDPFTVTVAANNDNYGSVSGGGEFYYGESCTVTATPADGYMFTSWTNNGDMVATNAEYTFNVTDNVDLVAYFSEGIMIGSGTETSQYLPSYNYYKYTLSEQIYTPAELGGAGLITSIAFYNGGAEKTRTYDFYMKSTTKNSFTGKTDWIAVSADDKVFSGSVTMIANDWTTITFSTPFVYDGTSNVVLVADDNTGSYTQSPHMSCRVFTATSQALYYYDDNTNFNPLSPPTTSGSSSSWSGATNDVLSVKNQLIITKESLGDCVRPTSLTATEVGPDFVKLSWTGYSESYNVQLGIPSFMISETFDNGIPADWTNDASYAWTIVDGHIQSGNGGMSNSTSSISVTVTYPADGTISFDFWSRGEGSDSNDWDKSRFYIDGELMFDYGQHTEWESYSTVVTAGTHTFKWEYKKDGSVDPTGDYFAVDNVLMKSGETDWNDPVAVEDVECSFTGLTPETTYCVRVQGVCADTETEWSEAVLFTTEELTTLTQTISLAAGTNWFSTYLEITLDDLKSALVEALPNATNIVIKSKTQNVKYNGTSWRGTLTWDLSKMYLITIEDACEITLEGEPINPADHPATILSGQSNWIAFPVNEEMTLDEAFADFNAVNGDVVKSKSGNAKYNGSSWRASGLTILEPGKGYLFSSNSSENRTLVFPSSKK
ncbi:MAG: carbohydrate-binding domain-containing protein [Bacteroidales bacterium]|nr:carbohydrate-binding domain-containing protein [Bacteroidales bacterium]